MTKPECDALLVVLGEYLAGELAPDQHQALQDHLEACPPCVQTADFQAKLKLLIAERCIEQVPDGFRERVTTVIASAAFESGDSPG